MNSENHENMRTCLVVDDSAFSRFRLRKMVETLGFSYLEASSGHEAVALYERHLPDLVVMDIIMPGIDGVEAVRRICYHNPDAQVIMMSSLSHQSKIEEATTAGAKFFIPKPATPESLREAVETILPHTQTGDVI